jgi:hypothetical protein
MYKRLKDLNAEMFSVRQQVDVKGKSIGWDWDMLPFTIKEGATTYIGAAPASGKTELWFEFLINLSCLHGWNHVVFSPETGSSAEIFAELCYKYIGKPYVQGKNSMTNGEQISAEMFVNEHFIVIDPIDEDLTITKFYQLVDEIERKEGIRIHTTTIDPWNELTEEFLPSDLGREDKYLSRILGLVRKNARKTGRHNCVINHVRDQPMVSAKTIAGTDISYFPMPSARDFAGGQVWFRKGLSVLIPWRPPYGLGDADGVGAEKNEVHLKVAKSKPKGVSKNGVYKMFLDIERYQYYMLDFKGNRVYANRGTTYKKESQRTIEIPKDGEIESTSDKLRRLANQNPF